MDQDVDIQYREESLPTGAPFTIGRVSVLVGVMRRVTVGSVSAGVVRHGQCQLDVNVKIGVEGRASVWITGKVGVELMRRDSVGL